MDGQILHCRPKELADCGFSDWPGVLISLQRRRVLPIGIGWSVSPTLLLDAPTSSEAEFVFVEAPAAAGPAH